MSDELRIADLSEAERAWLKGFFEETKARLESLIESHGMQPGLSLEMASQRIAILDHQLNALTTAMAQGGQPIACAKGCAFCCTLTIDVSPDEVFAIAQYLETHLDVEALEGIRARARANDAKARGLPPLERHRLRLFCPVMDPESRACLAHAARPNPCQGYLSLDVAACEADHLAPPGRISKPAAAGLLTNLVGDLRSMILGQHGAPDARVELTSALVALWRDGESESTWLGGTPVFTGAASWEQGGHDGP